MSDPIGWSAPFSSWTPSTIINETALNRIEGNIAILKNMLWGRDGSFDAFVDTPYFTAKVTKTIEYSIINKTVFLDIPTGFESPGQSSNTELQIEPDTSWPANIIPATARRAKCIFKHNGADANNYERPGYMLIPNNTSSAIICYVTKNALSIADGCYNYDSFYEAGGTTLKKAIQRQTVSYMLEAAP